MPRAGDIRHVPLVDYTVLVNLEVLQFRKIVKLLYGIKCFKSKTKFPYYMLLNCSGMWMGV